MTRRELLRRVLLGGVSFLAIAVATPAPGALHGHGSAGAVTQNSSLVNAPTTDIYMNFAHTATSTASSAAQWQGGINADGYPTTAPSQPISGSMTFPQNYYGHCIIKFTELGSFRVFTGIPFIVYAGGTYIGLAGATGESTFLNLYGQSNPSVEWANGSLISAIADNGSGKARLTCNTTNYFQNLSGTINVQVNNITGITPGVYALTAVDANHADLLTVSYSGGMAVITGGAGVQSEVIFQTAQLSWSFPSGQTYGSGATQMSGLIMCRKGDIDGTNSFGLHAGYQVRADTLAQFSQLVNSGGYIRWMDNSGVINSMETDFAHRKRLTSFSWDDNQNWRPDYWAGAVSRGSSDQYTCSNPTASPSSGPYQDGEQVQGQFDLANLTTTPSLQLGSRGFAPIYDPGIDLMLMFLSGTVPSVGSTITITFTASYFSGGFYSLPYTVQSSDTTLAALQTNINTAISGNSTLKSFGIFCTNNGTQTINYCPNLGSGTTFSATTPSGLTIAFGRMAAGAISASQYTSATYLKVLGGFVLTPNPNGALNSSCPVEVFVEACNRVGCNVHLNVPLFYSAAAVEAMATTVAGILNPGRCANWERANEDWNFSEYLTAQSISLGCCLNFAASNANAFVAMYSFYSLQVRLMASQAKGAWSTAGGAQSGIKIACACWFIEFNPFPPSGENTTYRLNSAALSTTNAVYAALGGPGGTSGTDFSSYPNRTADWVEIVCYAIYWTAALVQEFASNWTGSSIGAYASILQASANLAAGGPGNIASALAAWDQDIANGLTAAGFANTLAGAETALQSYDSGSPNRYTTKIGVICYEGGAQQGLGSSFAGTSDTGNDATGYAPLAAQFAANGWDTSPYGASDAVVALNVVTLFLTYLNSAVFYNRVLTTYNMVASAHAGRMALPGNYGYDGSSVWSLFPGNKFLTTAYQIFNAIAAFNGI